MRFTDYNVAGHCFIYAGHMFFIFGGFLKQIMISIDYSSIEWGHTSRKHSHWESDIYIYYIYTWEIQGFSRWGSHDIHMWMPKKCNLRFPEDTQSKMDPNGQVQFFSVIPGWWLDLGSGSLSNILGMITIHKLGNLFVGRMVLQPLKTSSTHLFCTTCLQLDRLEPKTLCIFLKCINAIWEYLGY